MVFKRFAKLSDWYAKLIKMENRLKIYKNQQKKKQKKNRKLTAAANSYSFEFIT